MSQELGVIEGRIEAADPKTKKIFYEKGELYVTSFSGGNKGPMIQLTPKFMSSHIQLDRDQVIQLVNILTEWL